MIKLVKKFWQFIVGLFKKAPQEGHSTSDEVVLPPVEEQQDVHYESDEYLYTGVGFKNI